MTNQERSQILKMIDTGKITPEEGLQLMQTLEQNPTGDEPQDFAESTDSVSANGSQSNNDPNSQIDRIKATARRLWQIPLWIGIIITIVSALGMYGIMIGPGMNFWFYFLILPLLLGVALTGMAVGTHQARWILVDVHQRKNTRPQHIILGFPLPLKFTAWFLRTFGNIIPSLKRGNVDEVIQILNTGLTSDEPMIVNVDESKTGETVKIYIG
jgi:hypothetical protein